MRETTTQPGLIAWCVCVGGCRRTHDRFQFHALATAGKHSVPDRIIFVACEPWAVGLGLGVALKEGGGST